MSDSKIKFRIHGDNIVECDRCLDLLAQAFDAQVRFLPSDPFRPAFELAKDGKILFGVDLIPGHGRWQINLQKMFREHGAPLREATDVLIARVSDDGKTELVVAALEFCSALPAGNNAWQRNGRALVCAVVGIPYLYFADVGGVELDAGRSVKASRFPNPIVPFSYLTASRAYRVICLPVYAPSPSSDAIIRADFEKSFGEEIGRRLVRAIIEGTSQAQAVFNLSDAILADSATLRDRPHAMLTKRSAVARRTLVAFPAVTSPDKFSEHDVDSALHLLFSRSGDKNVFEVMCNPPGGDWSGITLRNFISSAEHRWTSLPRVSGIDGKRPDHVVQIDQQKGRTILVAIESKDTAGKIEERVGRRMKKFTHDLIAIAPTIAKPHKGKWTPYSGEPLNLVSEVISAGAFCWESLAKLEDSLKRGELEATFAFEFHSGEQPSLLHVKTRANADFLVPIVRKAAENFGGRLKVQIY